MQASSHGATTRRDGRQARRAGMCDRRPYGREALLAREKTKAARAPTRLHRLPVLRYGRNAGRRDGAGAGGAEKLPVASAAPLGGDRTSAERRNQLISRWTRLRWDAWIPPSCQSDKCFRPSILVTVFQPVRRTLRRSKIGSRPLRGSHPRGRGLRGRHTGWRSTSVRRGRCSSRAGNRACT
jgi:hypothetical protein